MSLRSRLVATLLLFFFAAIVACGDGDGDGDSGARASGPDGDPARADGGDDVAPAPVVKRDFPLETPELGGYALVEAFPPTMKMMIPAAIVWTAPPERRAFILERGGNVIVMENGARRNVLDISGEVALESEGGALGFALHPAFGAGKPFAYVWYNAKGEPKNKQRLVRYTWSAGAERFESPLVMIEQEEERPEHNAGRLAFGPDGFLYFGNGDDINSVNHQTIARALFEGIFRIDVDSDPAKSHPIPKQPEGGSTTGYMIPNDNPFVGTPGALEEFWALGLRNPFMFSFDRATGRMWAGDVGDSFREEVNEIVEGGNYQWPFREGELTRNAGSVTIGVSKDPVFAYSHAEMGDLAAIFGGFVYRGAALPELTGQYVFSDWPSGRVWALDVEATPRARRTIVASEWRRTPMAIAEDPDGELYVLHFDGIAKLVKDLSPRDVPRRLVETTLFKDLATLEPEDGVVPYDINAPLWSDGAAKRRFVSVPPGQRIDVGANGELRFPVGTRFVKHFELPAGRRLETRVLVVGDETTYGLSYRWNADGTDAVLAPEGFDERFVDAATGPERVWHTPSWGECWSCHRAENRILGFTARQLHVVADGKPQQQTLAERGVLDPAAIATWPAALARPSDPGASLEDRALAYLAANCSGCHHEGASYTGGGPTWRAEPGVPLSERGLLGAPNHNIPVARGLGLDPFQTPIVAPGEPSRSLLVHRLRSTNHDLMMPPLGRSLVDPDGVKVVEDWIASLPRAK
ncbi:MAG: PQQ-dependent sugar dehydrogenase [Labilithrix sp.]|nr:PQQ-dependent sugar dehydrogenase [Labilithrix sp.]MCW5813218.1 PQQ-dependent sugar dehydrogenase [Labilithrix sp.]